MENRTKASRLFTNLARIYLILSLVMLFINTYYFWRMGYLFYYPARSYFEYFLNFRLFDFIAQLMLITSSIILFGRSRKEESKIFIVAGVYCFFGAFASLIWSFKPYFDYPFISTLYLVSFYVHYRLPGLISSLILLGTSLFFFIIRNHIEKKLLRPDFVKKIRIIDIKIDSDARRNVLRKISTNNLKDLTNSLTCLKCGSIAKLSFYKVIKKKNSRYTNKNANYRFNGYDVPVCDSCRTLYEDWYSVYKRPKSRILRTILNVIFVLLFLPMIFLSIFFLLLPLIGVVYFIVTIVRSNRAFRAQNSPYKNVKFTLGNKVLVRPDTFKKWTSLQNWVLYNFRTEVSGKPQLAETETILLDYLIERKGSAFSPRALAKRAIGESLNEEYVEVINKLLIKMTEKGIINYNYQDGKPFYFSS